MEKIIYEQLGKSLTYDLEEYKKMLLGLIPKKDISRRVRNRKNKINKIWKMV